MISEIMNWLDGDPDAGPSTARQGGNELRTAAAALLVEVAYVDESFSPAEQTAIRELLERRFDLSPAAAGELLATARGAAERSAQLFGFARTINERLSSGQRVELIEMLWEVAYADGALDALEDSLLRRIGGLLYVPDQERGKARQRVLQRLGRDDAGR
ncbi:MAG TPA: TerB family tellurite resistance protein [Stellaceae bacterium]|jgi:uncharacterized tellurite resistance protein B-like protein